MLLAATGAVLYDIRFPFRGDTLAYRFEFSSSSIDTKKHLAVSVGQFEEHELEGLELVDNPDSKRQRVLSAYVKTMRIDEQQGKFRETKLLEELVSIEESTSRWWDSDIVSKVPQRYERDYFLRILKAEILLEQKSGNFIHFTTHTLPKAFIPKVVENKTIVVMHSKKKVHRSIQSRSVFEKACLKNEGREES